MLLFLGAAACSGADSLMQIGNRRERARHAIGLPPENPVDCRLRNFEFVSQPRLTPLSFRFDLYEHGANVFIHDSTIHEWIDNAIHEWKDFCARLFTAV